MQKLRDRDPRSRERQCAEDRMAPPPLTLACVIAGWGLPHHICLDLLAFVSGVTVQERRSITLCETEKIIEAIAKCAVTTSARELFGDDYPVKVAMLASMSSVPMTSLSKLASHPMDIMLRMPYEQLQAFARWRLEYAGWTAPLTQSASR